MIKYIKFYKKINMIDKKILDKQDNIDLISTLAKNFWNIEVRHISMALYSWLNDENLIKDYWNWKYILYIPKNLNSLQQVELLDRLSKILWIWNTEVEIIKQKIKINLEYILRHTINEDSIWINNIRWLDKKEKVWILDDKKEQIKTEIDRVKNSFSSFFNSDFIQSIQESKIDYKNAKLLLERLSKTKNIVNFDWKVDYIMNLFIQDIEESFCKVFVELWNNNLKNHLLTFTQKNREELENQPKKENDNIDYYDVDKKELDNTERNFKTSINFEKYKEELKQLRDNNQVSKYNQKAIEFANLLLNELRKYPYQNRTDWNSFAPWEVLENKSFFCNSYINLASKLFEEIWIENKSMLQNYSHIMLEVIIWNKKYIFDPTYWSEIINFTTKNNKTSVYLSYNPQEIEKIKNVENEEDINYYLSEETDKAILTWIFINQSHKYITSWDLNNAFKFNTFALNIMWNNPEIYLQRLYILKNLQANKKTLDLYWFCIKKMNEFSTKIWILSRFKEEKRIIEWLILKGDFEKLKKYMLSIEN